MLFRPIERKHIYKYVVLIKGKMIGEHIHLSVNLSIHWHISIKTRSGIIVHVHVQPLQ